MEVKRETEYIYKIYNGVFVHSFHKLYDTYRYRKLDDRKISK